MTQAARVTGVTGRGDGVHAGRILQHAHYRGAGGGSYGGWRKISRFQQVVCLAWPRPGMGPGTGRPKP